MVNIMEKVTSAAGFLFFIGFVTMCSIGITKEDKEAEEVCNKTQYFKVINKDYENRSGTMLSSDYHFVMYFERYDKNKKIIPCKHSLKRVNITKYEYDLINVGEMYHNGFIDTRTYGYN